MNVKILKIETDELVSAKIGDAKKIELPSLHDGWRFNFNKHSKELPNSETYILTTEETPEVIEGCLIFQMIDKKIPYLSHIEVAPQNRNNPKKYEHVAGCLIAYAFKLSLLRGKGDYKAQLFLDVKEEFEEDAEKLISVYRNKYGALRLGETRLVIIDDFGHILIEKYLNRGL